MTNVVISQPMLFPWPGFFELAAQADIFVHLDDAQFSRGSFINRVQIKHPTGSVWMTIPLSGKGSFQPIRDLTAAGDGWKTSHRDLLRQSLLGAPYAADALDLFDASYAEPTVCDVLIAGIERTVAYLGLTRPTIFKRASGMAIEGKSWQRVLDIVLALGGTCYLTAHGAQNYLDHAAFEVAGVSVRYANYSMTPYPQRFGEFVPYVSVLDLVASAGPASQSYLSPQSVDWHTFVGENTDGGT